MTVLAVIPARHASTRFPGKPLTAIAGRPMVVHVWERTRQASTIDEVVVATEDDRIVECCVEHGIDVILTSSEHPTGTDRLAEVSARRPAEIVVNVQGDEPLVDPRSIDLVVGRLRAVVPSGVEVATGFLRGATPEQEASTSVVHLVEAVDGHVLALSRLPVPAAFSGEPERNVHVGLYAFTPAALARFAAWGPGPVERSESVELLRYLEHGERIASVAIPPGSIAVDHPEDVQRVEAALRRGIGEPPR